MASHKKPQQPLHPIANRPNLSQGNGESGVSKVEQARRAMAGSALSVTAPGKTTASPSPLLGTTVLTIPIREINYYEHNPRTDPNEAYDDIKESIRITGLDSIMQVMRLPGMTTYTVAKGGNTRLRALKELFEETRDPRFEMVTAQFVNFNGHAAAIADHLKENTLRGAMSFFDRAHGYLKVQQQIEAETKKKPGLRELVKTLKDKYGLAVDPGSLARYLHVAEHFSAVRTWINNPISKILIPAYNNLLRLSLKFELDEKAVHTDLESALARVGERCEKDPEAKFDTDACITEMQHSMAVSLGLTQYQLDFALAALEANPGATRAEIITTPAAPVGIGLLTSSQQGQDDSSNNEFSNDEFDPEEAGGDEGSGNGFSQAFAGPTSASNSPAAPSPSVTNKTPPTGAKSNYQIALELGRETREAAAAKAAAEAQGEGAVPAVPQASVQQQPTRRQQHATTVEEALDRVIDTVAVFTDLCGVGELCKTSLALPTAYVMEVPDDELILPSDAQSDARVRVAGWWMAAAMARQFDEEHCQLLPADCIWRKVWVREGNTLESNDLFQIVQMHMGAVLGDDAGIALNLEHLFTVLSDASRAAAFFALVTAVNDLNALRNGGR